MKHLLNQLEDSIPLLQEFQRNVVKWQKAVNLVSNKEISDLWDRHILDSAQLYFCIPSHCKKMVDMGSGGGFPAVVIAILNKIKNGPLNEIILVESDNKKSIFLNEISRIFGLNLTVLNERLENLKINDVDLITSRALGSVENLLTWGRGFYQKNTIFLLLKGKMVDEELQKNKYSCKYKKIKSKTNESGCILEIKEVSYK